MTEDELVPSPEFIHEIGIGDGDFRAIGEAIASSYAFKGWLLPHHTFLDIGCGLGRVARPLTKFISSEGRYIGFDINRPAIDWCKERYVRFPNFSFTHIDAQSGRYNPDGKFKASSVRFPLPDAVADFTNLSSVFTHMWPDDVAAYLKEVSRLLKPGGRCSITYFLLDPLTQVKLPTLTPETLSEPLLGKRNWHPIEGGYVRNKDRPEDVVLLDELMVRRMYAEAKLLVTDTAYGDWCKQIRGVGKKGQDVIVAIKPMLSGTLQKAEERTS
jgi:SAM-dependent methyltransferase